MTKQQTFVLVFTFIIGMCAGAYMFVTGFAPNYMNNSIDNSATEGVLNIRGTQFGGCQMAGVCASFELTSDRKYKYIPAYKLTEDTPEPLTGSVSSDVFSDLVKVVKATNLASLQASESVCNAATDGIDYRYDVVVDGVSYELNSCGTKFYGSLLYNDLLRLWGIMLKTDIEEEVPRSENLSEILYNRLHSSDAENVK